MLIEAIKKINARGDARTNHLKKNILLSFFLKGMSIVINFLLVSLSISYVDQTRYGIWLTLTSVLTWLSFFDIGMGNGLRNKLTAAIAQNDHDTGRKYVSTTYLALLVISLLIFIASVFINPVVQWNSLLNVPTEVDENIHSLVFFVIVAFCVQFVAQLLNVVLTAVHAPATADLISFCGQAALLITILILKYTVPPSLNVLIVAFSFIPVAITILASIFFYRKKLSFIAPTIHKIDFRLVTDIFNVGLAFFFIQIGTLVLFQTDNVIISNVLGPDAVTRFNVTYKLFSVMTIVFTVVMTPFWSAFTEAYIRNDFAWIKASIKRLRKLWLLMSFTIVPILILTARFIFRIWLNDSVEVSNIQVVAMGGYVICYTCLALNCYFLNGVGKLRIQLLLYFFVCITNIPLGILMAKLWGIEGVVFANIITFVIMNIVLWIQTNKIANRVASGLWNI